MSSLGSGQPLPYCGAPPDPFSIWHRWNLDPVLIFFITAFGVLYYLGARRMGLSRRTQAWFSAGWAIGTLALISPLCPLSVSLFAARVGQHMVLTLVAAPMVALGRPDRLLRARWTGWLARSPLLASGVFAILLWFWHSPAPYAATFASTAVYWSMHISMIAAAVWLWLSLLADEQRPMAQVAGGLFSTIQMGFLGALITLAAHPVYAPHLLTTVAWGMTPLQDQQLGGAIMWVPGCIAFLAAAMWTLLRVLRRYDWGEGAPAPAVVAEG